MLNKIIYIMLLLAATGIAACYKDKGNYTYTTLDEVSIDVTGIAGTRSMERFDTISVEPVVRYKGQTVNATKPQFPELTFRWTMYPGSVERVNDEHILDSSIRLHKMLDQPEMNWQLLFTVTNTLTGVKAFAKFTVAISPSLTEGWMVLYEKNGNTDVGLIVNDRISKAAAKDRVLYDIYSASNGSPIKGKPGSLVSSYAIFPPDLNLYVQTSEDVVSVYPNTFAKKAGFSDSLFWTVPSRKAPAYIRATEGRKEFLLNNNKIHKIDYSIIASGRRSFDDGAAGTYGNLAPWAATSVHGTMAAVVYDQTKQGFLKLTVSGTDLIPFSVQASNAPFDCNNVGMQFLLSDLGWNYYEHAVMKETATGKYYLLTANFKQLDNTTIGKGKYEMSNCPEISNINSIAAGYMGEIFYYSAGSEKVYQFKYTPGITETAWTAPANEKITCIRLQKGYGTSAATAVLYSPKNASKVLYVATFNETTGNGKVYEMMVNPSSGAVDVSTQRVYSGFGKINAMAWKMYIIL